MRDHLGPILSWGRMLLHVQSDGGNHLGMPQREKTARLLEQLERAVASVAGFALMREELIALQKASDSDYTIEGVEEMLRTSDQFAITAQKLLDSLKVDLRRVQADNPPESGQGPLTPPPSPSRRGAFD